jgi:hypothetical protein
MLVPVSTFLIAAKPDAARMPVLWTTLSLIAMLLVGALVIALVDRWRKRAQHAERQSAGDQLSHFRKLYERGELSREEFERVRALLSERLREDLQLPGHPAAPAPPGAVQAAPEKPPEANGPPPPPETGIRDGAPPG